MIRSTRGEPVSADLYLRGKAPRWTRSIRVIAREVVQTPSTVTRSTTVSRRERPSRPSRTQRGRVTSSRAAPMVPKTTSASVAPLREPPETGDLAQATDSQVGPKALDQNRGPEAPPGGGVTIAVVDPDEVIRTVLKDHVRSLHVDAVAYNSVASLAEAPGRHGPTVMVLGPSEPPQDVIERIEPLLKSRTRLRRRHARLRSVGRHGALGVSRRGRRRGGC